MVFNNIEQIASYYGLTPKNMREYHIVKTGSDELLEELKENGII